MRVELGDPVQQLTLAGTHREFLLVLLDGGDDHALEVVERGRALENVGDDALHVLEAIATAGIGVAVGKAAVVAPGLVLDDLAVGGEAAGQNDGKRA